MTAILLCFHVVADPVSTHLYNGSGASITVIGGQQFREIRRAFGISSIYPIQIPRLHVW